MTTPQLKVRFKLPSGALVGMALYTAVVVAAVVKLAGWQGLAFCAVFALWGMAMTNLFSYRGNRRVRVWSVWLMTLPTFATMALVFDWFERDQWLLIAMAMTYLVGELTYWLTQRPRPQ